MHQAQHELGLGRARLLQAREARVEEVGEQRLGKVAPAVGRGQQNGAARARCRRIATKGLRMRGPFVFCMLAVVGGQPSEGALLRIVTCHTPDTLPGISKAGSDTKSPLLDSAGPGL